MKTKPTIGVVPLWDDDKSSLWMFPGYMDGIIAAGGMPVMLPLTADEELIDRMADICDGFLFTGGHDVSPEVYGSTIEFDNVVCCPKRDSMELYLLQQALAVKKSVLGICRGIQFINAATGGTLYQDIPSELDSDTEHHQSPPYDIPVHKVFIYKDSPLFYLLRTQSLEVNSYHHQAVKELSPKLRAMAYSEDGIIEAVYMPGMDFVWAVQWHPEFSYRNDENSLMIFKEFVRSCML